jgi:hypothetical protein
MDEKLFEKWKQSRRRNKRSGAMPVTATVLALFSLAVITACAFGIGFAMSPASVIETVEGLAVEEHIPFENEGDFEEVSMHIVEVRLPDGETTGVMLPKGETLRPGAPMKIEHFRRAFGPVKFEWHTFAGYADAAK